MSAPPLTHHDMIKLAAPLVRRGNQIDLNRSDRENRYVEFKTQSSLSPATQQVYALNIGQNESMQLSRILIHDSGQIATLSATAQNLDQVMDAFDKVSIERQIRELGDSVVACSYTIENIDSATDAADQLVLQFTSASVCGLELRIDTSTGGSMPADVRVILKNKEARYLPDSLASGDDIPLLHRAANGSRPQTTPGQVRNLPDDFLAVLGPQWRPLRSQGDHWKGVLRTLGKGHVRTTRAERFIEQAVSHIAKYMTTPPAAYHEQLQSARWRVYTRRLQPLMLFLGILALMPLSYLLVSQNQLTLHPLALGLTPLLMVGVVVLTAREIPVMEIPPKPKPLPSDYWATDTGT